MIPGLLQELSNCGMNAPSSFIDEKGEIQDSGRPTHHIFDQVDFFLVPLKWLYHINIKANKISCQGIIQLQQLRFSYNF